MVKNKLNAMIKRFLESNNLFLYLISVKRIPAHWKQFLYNVPGMIKQLGIPTYFLTLSFIDLK